MNQNKGWIERLLSAGNGARFHKCALQVNPYAYVVRHNKSAGFRDEKEYNEKVLRALEKSGIEVIAITDHFAIQDSKSLIAEAKAENLMVFPGFEAETKDGIHMLCLFEPETPAERIDAAIHDCGIHSPTTTDLRSKYDCEELLAEAKKWGAICIAPHVVQEKGLLRAMQGGRSAMALWKNEQLQACSISGKIDDTLLSFFQS